MAGLVLLDSEMFCLGLHGILCFCGSCIGYRVLPGSTWEKFGRNVVVLLKIYSVTLVLPPPTSQTRWEGFFWFERMEQMCIHDFGWDDFKEEA